MSDDEAGLVIDECPNPPDMMSNGNSSSNAATFSSADVKNKSDKLGFSPSPRNEDESFSRKRKTEPLKSRPTSSNNNHSPERPPKKRKVTTTQSKSCQTEYDENCELKPDSRIFLDITVVFAIDPNTLFFTTKWKGRQYHGVITDGVPPKTHQFARERAERIANSKSLGSDNGQNASLKRGKRLLTRGGERRGKVNPEECLIFDQPVSLNEQEQKPKELNGHSTLHRCPHKQCGHIFQSVSEVNNHLIFQHVDEKAVLTENTASQSSSVQTTSTACDPIPEIQFCCRKCSSPLRDIDTSENGSKSAVKNSNISDGVDLNSTNEIRASRSPTPFSDISDDAPTLIKEESFEKRDENSSHQPLNFTSPLTVKAAPSPNAQKTSGSLPSKSSKTPVSSGVITNKPKSSLSTPSSTPVQLPQTGALGMGGNLPFSSQPSPVSAQQQRNRQAAALQQQPYFNTFLNMTNNPTQLPNIVTTAQHPMKKAGGSITTGAVAEQPSTLAGALQAQQMTAGILLNGLHNTPQSVSDTLRHKIHELKGETSRQSPSTSSSLSQQQNTSPSLLASNVINSTNSLQRGQSQAQPLPFMRPPISVGAPFSPFFARPPVGIVPPYLQPQQLMQLAAMINSNNMPNSFLPTSAQPK
ncbi:C2H2-type domain-containing protein [Aphelenchoides besseyi]|nr:C2H2-type domain-containing protein [Aphelenchoides besseyi]KAI6207947.1 C2H2-type domain-containing protein [Aphelenchoides besseyi]